MLIKFDSLSAVSAFSASVNSIVSVTFGHTQLDHVLAELALQNYNTSTRKMSLEDQSQIVSTIWLLCSTHRKHLKGHLLKSKEWCVTKAEKLCQLAGKQERMFVQLKESLGEQESTAMLKRKEARLLQNRVQCCSNWIRDSRCWSRSLVNWSSLVQRQL